MQKFQTLRNFVSDAPGDSLFAASQFDLRAASSARAIGRFVKSAIDMPLTFTARLSDATACRGTPNIPWPT